MDPLSLTANIIAVVTAAKEVSKMLQKIYHLRNAPEELFQFHNELTSSLISDTEVVLVTVREASAGLGDEDPDALWQVIYGLLRRAAEALHEFDDIMKNKIVVQANDTNVNKFSWRAWVQNASRLRNLSEALRTIRLEMNNTLTLMMVYELPRTRIRLAEVAMHNFNAESVLQRFEASTTKSIDAMRSSVNSLQTSIIALQKSPNAEKAAANTASYVRLQTSVFSGGSCNQTCLCRCHKFTTQTLPEWLEKIVGRVLIGYSGIPYRSSCSERRCQPDDSCLLTVSYFFPRWFVGGCMISFRDKWSPTEGHAISIRTPRVLAAGNEAVFQAVVYGNLAAIRTLFTQRLASPFDMTPRNFESILSMAVKHLHPEICAFLLSQYADPNIEDGQGVSSIDLVWNHIWTQPYRPEVKAIKEAFGGHLDLDDKIRDRSFTILHRIVLNLSPINLRAQLQTSTNQINLPCSTGRTPLHWAVLQSNTEAMETLIDFGARVDLQDIAGNTPLTLIARWGTTEALELLIAAMASGRLMIPEDQILTTNGMVLTTDSFLKFCLEQRENRGYTALGLCAFRNGSCEFARMLLDAGANVDMTFSTWSNPLGYPLLAAVLGCPLLVAVQSSQHDTTTLLLERGARLDLFDRDMEGALHITAIYGDLEMIQIVSRADGLTDLSAEHKDRFDYTPLQAFDIFRPQYKVKPEDKSTRQKCREAFLVLLSRTHCGAKNPALVEEIVSGDDSEDFTEGDSGVEESDIFYDAVQGSEGSM